MKIKLPSTFRVDQGTITSAQLVITKNTRVDRVDLTNNVQNIIQSNLRFLSINDYIFEDATSIHYIVNYKNGIQKRFEFESKNDIIFNDSAPVTTDPYIKINTITPFKNTDDDKNTIFSILKNNISQINVLPNLPFGNKNLLYYTVYGDGYVQLLNKSLESIKEKTPNIDFDVLLIIDEVTKVSVDSLDIISEFNVHYHLINKPIDGIEASMNKMKIYDFKLINNYNKILFLDCDIITVKDLNIIFDDITNDDVFYSVSNKEVFIGSYNTHYHGLKFNTDEIVSLATKQSNMPFNAGQYAFSNTNRMREHFKNINWFISVWPSSYFFEQSFVNVYFVYANILDGSLNKYFCLTNASVTSLSKKHSDETVAIHFIAPALNSSVKIDYIGKYFSAHK